MKKLNINNIKQHTKKNAIVTGANNGLGFETTRFFASKGISVTMACRNLEKAEAAKQRILKENPQANLHIQEIDLKSLTSVRNFATTFVEKHQALDILVNNAGIMIPPFELTKDGFESQMAVNYFSHFLLTSLLFPLLSKSTEGRVVSLSSIAHKSGKINFDNINFKGEYNKVAAYSQSKLACLMFAYELDRRLAKSNSSVKSLAAHPGVSATNLFQYLPKWFQFISPILTPFLSHSPDKAAQPIILAALSEEVKSGDYIGPSGFNEMKGAPAIADSTDYSKDIDIAHKLWAITEELTNTSFLSE
jgi:NAD(P)-dependent dehydrogenase (short-subunit alcohol dehydrogenase family)